MVLGVLAPPGLPCTLWQVDSRRADGGHRRTLDVLLDLVSAPAWASTHVLCATFWRALALRSPGAPAELCASHGCGVADVRNVPAHGAMAHLDAMNAALARRDTDHVFAMQK